MDQNTDSNPLNVTPKKVTKTPGHKSHKRLRSITDPVQVQPGGSTAPPTASSSAHRTTPNDTTELKLSGNERVLVTKSTPDSCLVPTFVPDGVVQFQKDAPSGSVPLDDASTLISLENAKVCRAQQQTETLNSNVRHHSTPKSSMVVSGRTDGCTSVTSDRLPRSTIGEHTNQRTAGGHTAKSQIGRVKSKSGPSKLKSKITAVKTSPTGRKASSECSKSNKTKAQDNGIKQQRSSETKQSRDNSKTKNRNSCEKVGTGSNKRKTSETDNRARKSK